jgi:hypothetical protein
MCAQITNRSCVLAVNNEYVPTCTVNERGANAVWVKCAGKTKERVTVMLLADSDGNKLDPFLVFKTRPSTKPKVAMENSAIRHGFGCQLWRSMSSLQHGTQLYGNTAGWWNSEMSIQFLYYHFGQRSNMHETVLLLWDDFSGHWREDVVIFARLLNVELMRVPAGYTYACQPADIAWNRPLKEHLRKRWIDYLLAQVRAAGPGVAFRLVPSKRADVVQWVKSAWMSLTEATIVAGFRKGHWLPIGGSQADNPSDTVASLTDWGSLVLLLQAQDVPTDLVDPAHDIEERETLDEARV